jgi:geranylgeranyl reductase family protein
MMDVIVIGAGPVGSFTAWRLAQSGLRVLVVEEHETIGEPAHCTGVVGRQVFDRFGLPRESILRELRRATFYSPGGHSFTVDLQQPAAYVIDRPAFDRRLAGLAVEAGASYLLGVRAEQVELAQGHIALDLRARAVRRLRDCRHRVAGRMCIVAGGSGCRIGREMGLHYPASYASGAHVEATVRNVTEVEIYCGHSIAPASFGWVVPVGDGRARVGLRAFGEARARLERFLDHPLLRGRIGDMRRPTLRPIPAEASPKTYAERALTVGDAAGQVKTTTGGGVLFGLICADIAARVAAEACRRDLFDEAFMRVYQRRWRRAIAGELRLGLMARRLAWLLRDGDIDRLFRRVGQDGTARDALASGDFDHHARPMLALLRMPTLLAAAKGATA